MPFGIRTWGSSHRTWQALEEFQSNILVKLCPGHMSEPHLLPDTTDAHSRSSSSSEWKATLLIPPNTPLYWFIWGMIITNQESRILWEIMTQEFSTFSLCNARCFCNPTPVSITLKEVYLCVAAVLNYGSETVSNLRGQSAGSFLSWQKFQHLKVANQEKWRSIWDECESEIHAKYENHWLKCKFDNVKN
jgi:hypothetical protein